MPISERARPLALSVVVSSGLLLGPDAARPLLSNHRWLPGTLLTDVICKMLLGGERRRYWLT